jgi:hypothetical protein
MACRQMREYDVALKVLLQSQARRTISELTGAAIAKWLAVELPKVQNLRLDGTKCKISKRRPCLYWS